MVAGAKRRIVEQSCRTRSRCIPSRSRRSYNLAAILTVNSSRAIRQHGIMGLPERVLQLAAGAWGPQDADGTSYPINDHVCISRAKRFLDHVGAAPLLAALAVVPSLGQKFGPGLGLEPRNLAAFLVARAVFAMAPRPMQPLLTCASGSRSFASSARTAFCSASCRAMPLSKGESRMASFRKSLTKKGTLRWQAVWQEPGPSGRTQRRTKNFASQKEARAYAQRMEQGIRTRPHR